MPTVPKTSPEHIVKAARKMIARIGADELSMQKLAAAVGVQAPALYKHFPDRAAILRAVTRQVTQELSRAQMQVPTTDDPRADLAAITRAYRDFALRFPRLYALMFSPEGLLDAQESGDAVKSLMLALQRLMPASPDTLEAARLLVAFTHGFITMQHAGAFRLGGDIEAAFEFGLSHVIGSLAPGSPRAQ